MKKVPDQWELGQAFSGRWEFYTNAKIPQHEPFRVYPLPLALSIILEETVEQRGAYERRQGEEGVQNQIIKALGLERFIATLRPVEPQVAQKG